MTGGVHLNKVNTDATDGGIRLATICEYTVFMLSCHMLLPRSMINKVVVAA